MSYFVDKNKLATRNSIEASSLLISAEEFIESKFNTLICEVVKKEVSDQMKAFNFTQERNSTSNNNNLVSNLQSEILFLREEILSKNKVIYLLLTEVKNKHTHDNKNCTKPVIENAQVNRGFEHENCFSILSETAGEVISEINNEHRKSIVRPRVLVFHLKKHVFSTVTVNL